MKPAARLAASVVIVGAAAWAWWAMQGAVQWQNIDQQVAQAQAQLDAAQPAEVAAALGTLLGEPLDKQRQLDDRENYPELPDNIRMDEMSRVVRTVHTVEALRDQALAATATSGAANATGGPVGDSWEEDPYFLAEDAKVEYSEYQAAVTTYESASKRIQDARYAHYQYAPGATNGSTTTRADSLGHRPELLGVPISMLQGEHASDNDRAEALYAEAKALEQQAMGARTAVLAQQGAHTQAVSSNSNPEAISGSIEILQQAEAAFQSTAGKYESAYDVYRTIADSHPELSWPSF